LAARVSRDGVSLYFQYYCGSDRRRLALGPYDESGVRGLSLLKARDRAAELSVLYRSGITDLHEHLERERQAVEAARQAAEEAARRERDAALRSTLRQLLEAYLGHLTRLGKPSARDAKSIFETHVFEAEPDLSSKKAAEATVDDFVGLIGKVAEAGKGRTAAKLRSYLRAAYSLAIRSKTDPSAPQTLRTFGIGGNPLASVGALAQFSKARSRVLSEPELGALLNRIDALEEGVQKDTLRLCLLTGGQRPVQLLRAKPPDIDLSARTLTLRDAKGARREPRLHILPLVKDAHAILERRVNSLEEGEPLFSTDGRSTIRIETISVLVKEIAKEMVNEKEAREPFQLRDLRRTVETMLASLKVSSDVRAHLQSHGLGGIQHRHYDRYSYTLEKIQALEKWARHLARLKANDSDRALSKEVLRARALVVPIKGHD
jgi:integrase